MEDETMKIRSKILNGTLTFSRSRSGYIYVDTNGKPYTFGDQICFGGRLSGNTMMYTGNDENEFAKMCRRWYRKFLKREIKCINENRFLNERLNAEIAIRNNKPRETMKITIEIHMDKAAFEYNPEDEIRTMLEDIYSNITSNNKIKLRDSNNNTVGWCEITEE
jgi:hypothetical protein